MRRILLFLALMVLFLPAAAEVSPSWNWNTYTGTVTWQVTVTEDQTGCGGPVLTDRYTVPVQFRAGSAIMGDVGHGAASGTFTSGNVLHIDSRSVADPPGSSDLSAYDVSFTPDCSAFSAKYTWAYTGPDGNCDGSTSLSGMAMSTQCPAASPDLTADIVAAQQDLKKLTDLQYTQTITDTSPQFARLASLVSESDGLTSDERRSTIADLSKKTQTELQAILAKDPANYYANLDMAELQKSQYDNDAYYKSAIAALSNRQNAEAKEDQLSKYILQQEELATLPTTANSAAVSEVDSEIPPLLKTLLGHDVSSVFSDSKKALKAYLYSAFCERNCDYLTNSVNEAAGAP